jgi:hypothetical protein
VPVAAEDETVAVSVIVVPVVVEELEEASVVVVEVVLEVVLLELLFVLELQPVLSVAARASAPSAII